MQPVLIDSNILIDIFSDNPDWVGWSRDQLTLLSYSTRLFINPIVYSELSIGFTKIEALDDSLRILPLKIAELPRAALFLAGRAFLQYRRSSGTKHSTLPDFFIGAHAAVNSWSIITRDARRMSYYFPSLDIITPGREFRP